MSKALPGRPREEKAFKAKRTHAQSMESAGEIARLGVVSLGEAWLEMSDWLMAHLLTWEWSMKNGGGHFYREMCVGGGVRLAHGHGWEQLIV